MKNFKQLLVVLLCVSLFNVSFADQPTVWREVRTVNANGKTYQLDIVWTNLKHPQIVVEPALAEGAIGKTASLKQLVDADKTALAGINGSFFNAYSDFQPLGTLIDKGQIKHIGNTGSLASIAGDNHFDVDDVDIRIVGAINGSWQWPNRWSAWNINHFIDDDKATMIFDANYAGPKPQHDYTTIVVSQGNIIGMRKGLFVIPKEGFIILSKNAELINKFKMGDRVDYQSEFYRPQAPTMRIDYTDKTAAIGAGPILLKGGIVVVNPKAEGFTENKITTMRARRSLLGVDANQHLAMVVVNRVTVYELASIAKAMGLVDAINLDGGASSGLYYRGEYRVKPGRALSNALVVKLQDKATSSVFFNNRKLNTASAQPVIQKDGKTMVLLQALNQAISGKLEHLPALGLVKISYDNKRYIVNAKATSLQVADKKMPISLLEQGDDYYVDMAVIGKAMGLNWRYDAARRAVLIMSDTVIMQVERADQLYNDKDYHNAAKGYQAALKVDANQLQALKQLADIYNTKLIDKSKAIDYYRQVLALTPDDAIALNYYAWANYTTRRYKEAETAFLRYIELQPDSFSGYYGVGLVNSSYAYSHVNKAKQYFRIGLTKKPPEAQRKIMQAYLDKK